MRPVRARWQRDTAGLPANYRARDLWAAPDGSVWLAGSAVLHRTANLWNVSPTGVEATLEALGGTRAGAVRVGGSSSAILARR